MLRQIDTQDLRIGMFVHKMGGSWFSHPFWKARFVIQDEAQLSELTDSNVPWVMIDTEKGSDISQPQSAPVAEPAAPAAIEPLAVPQGSEQASHTRRLQVIARAHDQEATIVVRARPSTDVASMGPLHQEMGNALNVAHHARQKMRDCYGQARMGRAVDVATVAPLVDDMMSSIQRHPHAFTGVLRLMKTSDYLHTHALAVSALMISLATQLRMPASTVKEAGLAGLLMDIGMGHVPSEIYEKDGPMTDAERTIMHSHVTIARDFLAIEGGIPDSVLDVCLHHHERLNGKGYPMGLAGDQISLFARMAAICDMYDALTSPRAHRAGSEPAGVIALMQQMDGELDATLLNAFIQTVGIYPMGSLVRLRSDSLALVLDQNPKNPVLPKVRKFYAIDQGKKVKPETIDLVYAIGREDIVCVENPADWNFDNWDALSNSLWRDALGLGTS